MRIVAQRELRGRYPGEIVAVDTHVGVTDVVTSDGHDQPRRWTAGRTFQANF